MKSSSRLRPPALGEVVLGIVAGLIWLSIAYPDLDNGMRRHRAQLEGRARSDLAVLRNGVDLFKLDCGRYPTSAEGFHALRSRPGNAKGWRGPYLDKDIASDPWGNPYRYRLTKVDGRVGFIVESYGADGKPGGVGDDGDITDGND